MDLTLNLDLVTIEQAEAVEEQLGIPIDRLGDASLMQGATRWRALAAMFYLANVQRDPSYTIAQARQTPITEIATFVQNFAPAAEANPTAPVPATGKRRKAAISSTSPS